MTSVPFDDHISPDALDEQHYDVLAQALRNVLATDLALNVYAQIIDGLPTAETVQDHDASGPHGLHPVYQHHEICPAAIAMAKQFRGKFTADYLTFDSKLIQAYNDASCLSKAFNLRLIELTACSLHQIGGFLHQIDDKLHDIDTTGGLTVDEVMLGERPSDDLPRIPPSPTLFQQPMFDAHEQYPNGVADMVGYRAEDRIMGGVSLFDRSRKWGDEDEPNVYFQSCRKKTTSDAWQLTDEQQAKLLSFLLDDSSEADLIPRPIPVLPTRANTVVVDLGDAIPLHSIYRDEWEREFPPQNVRPSCHRPPRNLPMMQEGETFEEMLARLNRGC